MAEDDGVVGDAVDERTLLCFCCVLCVCIDIGMMRISQMFLVLDNIVLVFLPCFIIVVVVVVVIGASSDGSKRCCGGYQDCDEYYR
jgi:choline-glycine betaine transporter